MVHIACFLKDIYFNWKTGHLRFRRGDTLKNLYFQDGSLIFTKTNVPDERLGEILYNSGKISKEAFRSIPQFLKSAAMLGETLVQKKFVSQKDLYEGLIIQMTSITISLFPYFDAEISFRERDRFFEEGFEQKINLVHLIEQGIRMMPFHRSLQQFMENRVPVTASAENVHRLTEEEKFLLNLVDGKKDAGDLLAAKAGSPEEFWKTLYLLYCLEVVDLEEPRKKRTEEEGGRARTSADLEARIEEALELRKKLPDLDYEQVLGVSAYADETEIKKAYFKMARKFHPDLFGRHLTPEFKSQIEEVFDYITKAYRFLLSREPKAAAASKPAAAREEIERDRSKNADIRFRQGKTLYSRGRFEEAIALLEEAVRRKDDKGDYYLLLALAESKIPALRKKAERNFLRAIKLEAWNPEGFVGLGFLYKQEGLLARAKIQFEKALEIDPEHKTALQELRLITGKSGERKGLKDILSMDLFGSKKK